MARMAAFMPEQSPPDVRKAMRRGREEMDAASAASKSTVGVVAMR